MKEPFSLSALLFDSKSPYIRGATVVVLSNSQPPKAPLSFAVVGAPDNTFSAVFHFEIRNPRVEDCKLSFLLDHFPF